ncbi:hypothetical protein SAMN02799622_00060 [Methylobacterium sp. UNC378MF]|nr:hypothetical protein SAMN02799622_00060 [Methylobacterium sp. UNC378MF]
MCRFDGQRLAEFDSGGRGTRPFRRFVRGAAPVGRPADTA